MTSPRADERDIRIRQALRIADGPLPKVRSVWLINYYEHLLARLQFPFPTRYAEDIWQSDHAGFVHTVLALLDPGSNSDCEHSGLLCRVRKGEDEVELPLSDLEVEEDNPNFQLIEDYWYWFWNWRFDPGI